MKKIIAIALVAIALAGCKERLPLSSATTNNRDYEAAKLFTHDGCTVYRFYDYGNYRYFTKCEHADSATSWNEYCGKGCSRQVAIDTTVSRGGE